MRWSGILAVGFLLGGGGSARAADPPDAAALVRSVRTQEAWLDHVDTFWIKADITFSKPPASIARRRRELERERPGANLDGLIELQPRVEERVEVAFDRRRVRTWERWPDGREDLNVWDGRRFVGTSINPTDARHDGAMIVDRPTNTLAMNPFYHFSAFRAAGHPFWWHPTTGQHDATRLDGLPEEFAYAGVKRVGDAVCDVVCHWGSWTRLYVDRDSGRLRALRTGTQSRPDLLFREIAFLRGQGYDFRPWEFTTWLKDLTEAERQAIDHKLSAHLLELTDPIFEFGLEDDREVAPGRWLPMTQTMTTWYLDEQGKNAVDSTHQIRVTAVHVDEPLPDDLFQVDLPAGISISDATANPPLRYPEQPGRTPAGWAEIIAQARQQAKPDRKRGQGQTALVGQPLPEFPLGAAWLGGPPLTGTNLAGRVILLVAWADWSDLSRVDLPALAALGRDHAADGLTVLGLHPPETDPATIARLAGDRAPGFPTLIDAPFPLGTSAWGVLYHQLGIDRIPYAILIGRDGTVAATGSPTDLIPRAIELARPAR